MCVAEQESKSFLNIKKKNKILTKMIVMISTNYLVALLFDMREKQQREEGSSTNPALKEKRKLKSR